MTPEERQSSPANSTSPGELGRRGSKLWGGRFTGSTDELVERLNNSLVFDARLWREDIAGSIAHATMLGEQKIIPESDSAAIIDGLRAIESGLATGEIEFDPKQEDVHSAVETLLRERIGPAAGKLHTARSRNDQVATDIRLYLRGAIRRIEREIVSFQRTIEDLADFELGSKAGGLDASKYDQLSAAPIAPEASRDAANSRPESPTILPGYTHLQHAQPVLLSHHLMAYFWMFQRDRERLSDCYKRVNILPLGAGALAGTSFPIDRERVAELLDFDGICENSLDAVSDRDFAVEFLTAASILMMHCSRLAEELIIWNSPEFAFVELDDSVTTGSSIMPQKKNPDVAELARGKTGRVYGSLMTLLTVMKGLPLAYNKDMQEDKEPLFDTVDTLLNVLPPLERTLKTARFRRNRMEESLRGDFSTATDLADHLVRSGMPFRDAHRIVGEIVRDCISKGIGLESLDRETLTRFTGPLDEEAVNTLSVEASIAARSGRGGTSAESVRSQIDRARTILAD